MKTKKLTSTAVLTAVSLIVFVIEAQIPSIVPVPGIKPGLANIVTLFALYTVGIGPAAAILVLRITLGSLILGQVSAMIYSFAGGIAAFLIAVALKGIFKDEKKMWIVSAMSAIAHNCGQMAAAIAVTRTHELIWYLPALVSAGIITGVFTGICAGEICRRMSKKGC